MEAATVDVLMQGATAVMQQQNLVPGLGLGLGLEWAACVAVVATTIVVALVSVKRETLVIWSGMMKQPITIGGGGGHVRVQVKSISSSSSSSVSSGKNNCIVTTTTTTSSRLFSAELNLDTSGSSSSIQESQEPQQQQEAPADNNNNCQIATADHIAAATGCVLNTEMVFQFHKTTTTITAATAALPKLLPEGLKKTGKECRPFVGSPTTTTRWTLNRSESLHTEGIQFFLRLEPRNEEIKWNPGTDVDTTNTSRRDPLDPSLSSVRNPRAAAAAAALRSSSAAVFKTMMPHGYWNSLLRLSTRDAVLCTRRFNRFCTRSASVEVSPILVRDHHLDRVITLKKDVVRIWDATSRKVLVSLRLPSKPTTRHGNDFGSSCMSSFDVHRATNTAALGSLDGDLSLVDLRTATCYSKFQQGTRQAGCGGGGSIRSLVFDSWSSSAPNTLISGGPAFDNGLGYSLSLWDTRTDDRQMHTNLLLKSASAPQALVMQEHKVFMKSETPGAASALDLRMMMSGLSVAARTIPLEYDSLEAIGFRKEEQRGGIISSLADGNWWDDDDTRQDLLRDDNEDEDPDWDFQNPDGSKVADQGSSLLGRCVQAVTRSFSSKSLGR